jgi:peptidoglycan/LPS O-acetylase OafA/YrhL
MGTGNATLWLFLATTVVASLTFVAIVVWAEKRLQERQAYYRFEFRKRLVEAGKMDAASFAALMRYEHDLRMQQGRQKLLVAAFVILGLGVGTCVGLQFTGGSVWMVGLIPACLGLSMLAVGVLFAPKPNPGPPPLGWSSEPGEKG